MQYKIAVYTRISIKDKKCNDETQSIKNQRDIIENFIKNNSDICSSDIFYYSDEGYSGRTFKRPYFEKLIEDAKKGKINCIIVKDLSRFGRDYIEVNTYLDKVFPFLNVRFISINDNYDSNNNKNKTLELDVSFKNLLYNYYSKDLSNKVITGIKNKARQGEYIRINVPFGYKKNSETKKVEIDEETAPIVKMIFEMVAEGKTFSEVCDFLNENKIPTRSEFKMKNGAVKNYPHLKQNKIWRNFDLISMLQNEIYMGTLVLFKTKKLKCGHRKRIKSDEDEVIVKENIYPPIVSEELFFKVNANRKKYAPTRDIKNIFAYKLKCGHCGYALKNTELKKHNEVFDKKYYCNSKNELYIKNCKNTHIKESELKRIVFNSFRNEILLRLEEDELKSNFLNLKTDLKKLSKEVNNLKSEKRNLYEIYLNQQISKDEYVIQKNEKEISIQNTQKQIQLLQEEIFALENITDENKLFEKYIKSSELTREMVEAFVDCIYLYDDAVNIKWSFKKI